MRRLITLLLFVFRGVIAFSQSGSQVFTESGTFTVPDGVTLITIEVAGAGGDGGGNGGGGGGGGGYASGEYTVTPGASLMVTVGINGGGAFAGTTSVGDFISASGGENGFSVSNPNLGGGGPGGVGTGGTIINRTGGTGGGGYWTYFGGGGGGAAGAIDNGSNGGNTIVWNGSNCLTPGGDAGVSGGAPGGDGGKGAGFIDNFCSVSDPAGNGVNYGGGGGGGNGNGGIPGTGAGGYCSVSWGIATGFQSIVSTGKLPIVPTLFNNKINLININGNEDYLLINTVGQIIWNGKNIEQEDFSYLTNGLYFLSIQNEHSIRTIELSKQ